MKSGITIIFRGAEGTIEFENFSIETTASDEKEFYISTSTAMSKILCKAITKDENWEYEEHSDVTREIKAIIESLLPLIVDISCKIKGYKSPVNEYRVLSTGLMYIQDKPTGFSS